MSSRGVVLVTGSAGLVGRVLCEALRDAGWRVREVDVRARGALRGDVRDARVMAQALEGLSGVVHLAAVSRVRAAELDPALCWQTNVGALETLLTLVQGQQRPPWLLWASSREVYGNARHQPVAEDSPPAPANAYARSKLAGERRVARAVAGGLRGMTVRLSNVYGRAWDHPDRVIPAFVRAALAGHALHVLGPDHCFDFTQVDDVVRGLLSAATHLHEGGPPIEPVHFVTGRGTSLAELAALVRRLAGGRSPLVEGPPSPLHASHFVGCPERAWQVLGWRARCPLEEGLARLLADVRQGRRRAAGPGPSRYRAQESFNPVMRLNTGRPAA